MSASSKLPESVPASVSSRKADLSERLTGVTRELAGLNRDLAAQLTLLASQTGDPEPLIGAVSALRKVQDYVAQDENPRENAEVHVALADTLFQLGRAKGDVESLNASIASYRSAITLTSLLGEDDWRHEIRTRYKLALAALADRTDISARRVA